jgi:hypothetical protein
MKAKTSSSLKRGHLELPAAALERQTWQVMAVAAWQTIHYKATTRQQRPLHQVRYHLLP